MIKLNEYFRQSQEFPKIEVEKGFRFIEYRAYEEQARNQVMSERNFIVFVLQGRKTIFANGNTYLLDEEKALFLRKGGYQMSLIPRVRGLFQSVLFFIDDAFMKQFARKHADLLNPWKAPENTSAIPIRVTAPLSEFYRSALPYFNAPLNEARRRGLGLKFEELLLNLIAEPENDTFSYFLSGLLTQKADLHLVMEQNYHLNLPIETFARLSQRSVSGFKRDFKATFQQSPGKWLLERRLRQASHLLSNSPMSVTEVALDCGFESASHFSQAFRKRFGTSPSDWKKN
jgi:AraC-like DNA-binding protein